MSNVIRRRSEDEEMFELYDELVRLAEARLRAQKQYLGLLTEEAARPYRKASSEWYEFSSKHFQEVAIWARKRGIKMPS